MRKRQPLHKRQKKMSAHLSPELREKLNRRSTALRKGDKVRVMRGSSRGTIGKVDDVDLKTGKVEVEGVEVSRVDGTKRRKKLEPSSLMIIELNLEDEKRKKKLEES